MDNELLESKIQRLENNFPLASQSRSYEPDPVVLQEAIVRAAACVVGSGSFPRKKKG